MEEIKFLSSFPFNVHSRTSSSCNKEVESEADKKPIVKEKSIDEPPLVEEPVKVAMEPEQTETEAA